MRTKAAENGQVLFVMTSPPLALPESRNHGGKPNQNDAGPRTSHSDPENHKPTARPDKDLRGGGAGGAVSLHMAMQSSPESSRE